MFHVMLVLPALIVAAVLVSIVVSVLLFGIFAVVISVLGGTSVALLIKNKTLRKLLLIISGILSFLGLVCLIPFITVYAQLPELFFTLGTITSSVCMGILAFIGIKASTAIQNKVGKAILIVVFSLVIVASASFAIFVPVVRGFLTPL